MKILFVAFPFSVHTARWINQLQGTGWEIHLFPSMDFHPLHPSISGVTYYQPSGYAFTKNPANRYVTHFAENLFFRNKLVWKFYRRVGKLLGMRKTGADRLRSVIKKLQPDIIHSLETQHAGYLVKLAKEKGMPFPVWVHSNWGIDLHFFGRLPEHREKIKEVLREVRVLIVEGKRDAVLASGLGFQGKLFTFPSVGGGFIIKEVSSKTPSTRKKILVKGTQDNVRRGLVALNAIERCAAILGEYEVVIYSATHETKAAAGFISANTGLKITVVENLSQEELIRLNSEARLNICVNLSDGLPNSMLEAMMMGAFPIQSNTSLADEWIQHGRTGMLVPPEDPETIEQALRKALTDDEMVNAAAEINRRTIQERLEYNMIKEQVIKMYETVGKFD